MKKNKLLMLGSILALSLTSFNAFADNESSKTSYDTTHGIGGIEIIGDINRNTADVVHKAFGIFEKLGFKKVVIHLNSPGGEIDPGADIIQDMLTAETKYGMTVSTYVDHRELCASMCTAVFAVGNFRVAAWDSLWVFHSPYASLPPGDKLSNSEKKELNKDLDASRKFLLTIYSNVDPQWTEKVLKPYIMSPTRALRLTGAQIVDFGSPWWIDYVLEDSPAK